MRWLGALLPLGYAGLLFAACDSTTDESLTALPPASASAAPSTTAPAPTGSRGLPDPEAPDDAQGDPLGPSDAAGPSDAMPVCAVPARRVVTLGAASTDGMKDGDETDVDCGGAHAPSCASGKTCLVHADCVTDGCLDGRCAKGRSCRSHYGGATCGSGEDGDPKAKHEDCCTSIEVTPSPPNAKLPPYAMDKYLITAGRMRAFLEDVHYDVKCYVASHLAEHRATDPKTFPTWEGGSPVAMPDAGSDAATDAGLDWSRSVPGSEEEAVIQLGEGHIPETAWGPGRAGPGCFVKGIGAPAYWFPPADQTNAGNIPRGFPKEVLDEKAMNCATFALFAAFCYWDGQRLPRYEEWAYAVDGTEPYPDGGPRRPHLPAHFPWGAAADASVRETVAAGSTPYDLDIQGHAVYCASWNGSYCTKYGYSWPGAPGVVPGNPANTDYGNVLPIPGRYPQGVSKLGFMDLAGALENFGSSTGPGSQVGWFQFSFQEQGTKTGHYFAEPLAWGAPYMRHWAIGARCARTLP